MTWLDRLREWLRARLPTSSTEAAGTPAEAGRRCAVCGTVTRPDATACPLCGGSEFRPSDEPEPVAAEPTAASSPAEPTRRETDTDEAAAKLRRLRSDGPTRDGNPDEERDDRGEGTEDPAE